MIDAVAAVRGWGNANASLVGQGRPVSLGFFQDRLRSPGRGCYALVGATFDDFGLDAEGTTSLWRLSVSVLSATDAEAAEAGAFAVADALRGVSALSPTVNGVRLLLACNVNVAPDPTIGDDEPASTVLADLYLARP